MERFNELEQKWEKRRRARRIVMWVTLLATVGAYSLYRWSQSLEISPPPYTAAEIKQPDIVQQPIKAVTVATAAAEPVAATPKPAPEIKPDIPPVQFRLRLDRSFEATINDTIQAEASKPAAEVSATVEEKLSEEKRAEEPASTAIMAESVAPTEKGSLLIENFHLDENYENGLKVARFFFETESYQKAIEWALKANKLDSADDESWLIFAEASLKIGEKEQARNALATYLQKRDSIRVRQLYNQLREE